MYNGIGLTTARGSGTSGHVTKNLSYVKPEFFRNKLDSNSGRNRADDSRSVPKISSGNRDILEHNKKRAVEARLFALQESLEEQGFTDVEIEEKVSRRRQELNNDSGTETTKARGVSGSDTHSIAIRKQEEMVRARNAFGIKDDFVTGEAFDTEVQERKKREAQERRERGGDRERRGGSGGGEKRSRKDYSERERDQDRHGGKEGGTESRHRSNSRRERSRSRSRDRSRDR